MMIEDSLRGLPPSRQPAASTATAADQRPCQADAELLASLSLEDLEQLNLGAPSAGLRAAIDAEVSTRIDRIVGCALQQIGPSASGCIDESASMAERLAQAQAQLKRITRFARPDPASSDLAATLAYIVQVHLERVACGFTERATKEAIDSVSSRQEIEDAASTSRAD
jgi:hypothetical protein